MVARNLFEEWLSRLSLSELRILSHFPNSTQLGGALQFWREAGSFKEHELLSLLAVKLFSVRPHAMSVERVFSTMGWINSARRGSMTTKNLEMATKVYLAFRKKSKLSITVTDFGIENLNALSETSPDSEDLFKDFGVDEEGKLFLSIFCNYCKASLQSFIFKFLIDEEREESNSNPLSLDDMLSQLKDLVVLDQTSFELFINEEMVDDRAVQEMSIRGIANLQPDGFDLSALF